VGLPRALRNAILRWYDAEGRSIPFRGIRDPYPILVSEAMAQQTQVARAAEAWSRFISAFPDVASLAAASPADVLRAWRGLGYNRRAVNLQRAARVILDTRGGRVPDDLAALVALPGVGPYTARAVLALAYGQAVGPVDTNVRRVIGRVVAGDPGALRPAELQVIADASVPPERPADWTAALMDLGATVCVSRDPACADCPASRWCAFGRRAATGGPEMRPSRPRRARSGSQARFQTTTRWLRGRLLDRLRDAPGEGWAEFADPIGDHPVEAVREALAGLVTEDLAEAHPSIPGVARLPIA
jgi:A/G-specific adenine glycosylase